MQVRKQSREAITRERNQQVALLIAAADTKALTVEQQREMLEAARSRAEATAVNGEGKEGGRQAGRE